MTSTDTLLITIHLVCSKLHHWAPALRTGPVLPQTSPYWCYIWQEHRVKWCIQIHFPKLLWERNGILPKLAKIPRHIHKLIPAVWKNKGKWYTNRINLPRLCHLGPTNTCSWSKSLSLGLQWPRAHSSYHRVDLQTNYFRHRISCSKMPAYACVSCFTSHVCRFQVGHRDSPWPNKSDLIAKTELVPIMYYREQSDSWLLRKWFSANNAGIQNVGFKWTILKFNNVTLPSFY